MRRAGLEAQLAALRVSVLVEAGRVSEAEDVWRAGRLPSANAACLDLALRGWRETEALACARVQLLKAFGDVGAAIDLERALARLATDRGLRRTLMRSLALRVRLANRARDPDVAHEAAANYLHLFRVTDYARPMPRAGAAATAALERILDAHPNGPLPSIARRLLAMGPSRRRPRRRSMVRRWLCSANSRPGKTKRSPGRLDCRRTASATASRTSSASSTWDADRTPYVARALGILPPVR